MATKVQLQTAAVGLCPPLSLTVIRQAVVGGGRTTGTFER